MRKTQRLRKSKKAASWTPVEYKIVFHGAEVEYSNDMSNSNNATFTVESETYVLREATRHGYAFVGWYDNPECTGEPITEREKGRHSDLHLYAKWVKED